MARGFVSGALWGGVVSLGVAGVASVVTPLPPSPDVGGDAAALVTQLPVDDTASSSDASVESTPLTGLVAPKAEPPIPDTLVALEGGAVVTADTPLTGPADRLGVPSDSLGDGDVAFSEEDPIFPNPQALAPMIPQGGDDPAVDTDPAPLPVPKADAAIDNDSTVQDGIAVQAVAPLSPTVDAAQDDVAFDVTPSTSIDPVAPALEAPEVVEVTPESEPATEAEPTPEAEVVASVEPELETSLTPEVETAPAAEVVPEVETAPDTDAATEAPQVAVLAPSTRPQIGTPAASLTQPRSNTATDQPSRVAPIDAFAEPFSNPDNKALMSIVLMDSGDDGLSGADGISDLRNFPYTVSFAVDTSLPDAAERMALYRAEGFEVLALVDLPDGAQASDVETTLGTVLPQMDGVVGVLEGTKAGLQGSREVADQVTAILAQTGHGLVTQDNGLNTMPNLARKAGVPAQAIFRDFDSKDQTARVIRRFLDQAAFKADREGAVIMLGRLRPDTITALLVWGLQDRAGQVALVPISGVLKQGG